MVNKLDEVEKTLLHEVDDKVPWAVLKEFSTLTRESGSEDERRSAEFLTGHLDKWGIDYTIHWPELYLSLPRSARLRTTTGLQGEYVAKTPAFSVSTNNEWMQGELVYQATEHASDVSDIFSEADNIAGCDFSGKVVLSEGIPMPGKVRTLEKAGAKAAVFISPGKNSHNAIATTIWGAPDLDNWKEEPTIPVLSINRQDGDKLISTVQAGTAQVEYSTCLEKDWFACPIIDIFIRGNSNYDNEKYVLLHGHLDSWHEGISDNATGNAAMLEMARVFHKHKDKLHRSIRIAYWTGHSYGRYAGSTWFADEFAIDLAENCVAQVNCDSPGCRGATSFEQMMWMPEAEKLCSGAIMDATNQVSQGKRPIRAGDYSFNNIGITSFYMLSSVIPEQERKAKNMYAVGGSGGNIEWHTEDDLLDVADMDLLIRDIKVYILTLVRTLNASVLPYNFIATVDEISLILNTYQEQAGEHFDLHPAIEAADELKQGLKMFYENIDSKPVKTVNQVLLDLARILVPINYTRRGLFRHDPALEIPALPDLAPASKLKDTEGHEYNVTRTHLTRGQNRLIWSIRSATKLLKITY